ncbi:MFS transporter [Marinibaculum pumilum]|uniref:MFS transporter n=1 Tax=Marinibaculum pumilum TaxID=1766165 RepID=A0ABV7L5E0_9PROT
MAATTDGKRSDGAASGDGSGGDGSGAGFAPLAWGNLFAQSAEQIAVAAAPLVAVLAFDATVAETGSLQTGLTLPFLLLALPAGVLVDRLSRRRLMVGAEVLRFLSLAVILALFLTGDLTWPLLAVLGFVGVCGSVVFTVAAPAMVPELVPRAQLTVANSRIELARTAAFTAGPAVGGAVVGWAGGGAAFALATLLAGLAVGALCRLPETGAPSGPRRRIFQDLREGAGFVFRHRLLMPVFVTQFVFGTALYMILAVFVPYAVRHLGMSATGTGLTLAMLGAGMVLGALLAPRIMRLLPFGRVVAVGPVSGLAASVLLASTIWSGAGWVAALAFFLLGAGPILWIISTTTLRQAVTPARLLGRASALNVLAFGARPIGAGLGALVGGLYGVEACLMATVAIFAAQAAIILASPVVGLPAQPGPVADPVADPVAETG